MFELWSQKHAELLYMDNLESRNIRRGLRNTSNLDQYIEVYFARRRKLERADFDSLTDFRYSLGMDEKLWEDTVKKFDQKEGYEWMSRMEKMNNRRISM